MMMFMGGTLIVVLLLVLAGVVVANTIGSAGLNTGAFARLLVLSPQPAGEISSPPVRRCNQCDHSLQRGWTYCPGCGVEVYWV